MLDTASEEEIEVEVLPLEKRELLLDGADEGVTVTLDGVSILLVEVSVPLVTTEDDDVKLGI